MKRLYWRPQKCSTWSLVAVAAMAVVGIMAVETFTTSQHAPLLQEKLSAANLAADCFNVIRLERLSQGYALDRELDVTASGLIGLTNSPVTSISGHLDSKRASVNPNFAAAVVQMLHDAGVCPGDRVAVGYTGSLPAMNVAVCAACAALEVEPIIIASASSSQFGANFPNLLWIDMERVLHQRGLIPFRSRAISIGGYQDQGLQFTQEGHQLIRDAISRNAVEFLEVDSYRDSIDQRMAIYKSEAKGNPIRAYINVGGGTVSVGKAVGKQMYRPGLNLVPPPGATDIDSIMTRFADGGIPTIHLVEVRELARQFDLPQMLAAMPAVGEGGVYGRPKASRLFAGFVLAAILLALRAIMLVDWGHTLSSRLRSWVGRPLADPRTPEWMV